MSDTDTAPAVPDAPSPLRAGALGVFMPHRHYWIVGGSTTAVWSSATFGEVPVADPDYLAWRDARHRPDAVGSLADIDARLVPYGLSSAGPIRSVTGAALLSAMTDDQAKAWQAAVDAGTPATKAYWYAHYNALIPDSNLKMGKLARAAALDLGKLFAAAGAA